MKNYILQGRDFCCFPIAVQNACIWADLPCPKLEKMIDVAKCRHGGTIYYEPVLELTKLKWCRATATEVMANQGIMTMDHPRWNLHAIFVFNEDNKLYHVNGQLREGELISCERFQLPKWDHHQRAFLVTR